jgi:hypothetical protein
MLPPAVAACVAPAQTSDAYAAASFAVNEGRIGLRGHRAIGLGDT